MPAPTTAADFLALVRRSGLVEPTALEPFAQRLADDPPPDSPKALAALLVQEGLLTNLHARHLLRGQWRKFDLCGKYKLLEHLGTGGMGQVFLCEHMLMGRRVAVKILPPERAGDEVCLQRFRREARAAAALNHPNIVRAHDLDSEGRLHFIVMEYVDGASLQAVVRKAGPLPVGRACHYVAQAAEGLQHAHEAGLVHRDIKPANLLLDRQGQVKILDFGLARLIHDSGDNLTRNLGARNLIGTADYLAPEQASNSHTADIRADLYGLGATFYYLLTGRPPFPDGSVTQKLIWHQTRSPESVRRLRPDVPAGVAAVVARLMMKQPADRYQTPAEVVAALKPWTADPVAPPPESEMPRLSRAARQPEPSTHNMAHGSHSTLHAEPQPAHEPTPVPVRRRPRVGHAIILALLLAALGVAGWLGWVSHSHAAKVAGPHARPVIPDERPAG